MIIKKNSAMDVDDNDDDAIVELIVQELKKSSKNIEQAWKKVQSIRDGVSKEIFSSKKAMKLVEEMKPTRNKVYWKNKVNDYKIKLEKSFDLMTDAKNYLEDAVDNAF